MTPILSVGPWHARTFLTKVRGNVRAAAAQRSGDVLARAAGVEAGGVLGGAVVLELGGVGAEETGRVVRMRAHRLLLERVNAYRVPQPSGGKPADAKNLFASLGLPRTSVLSVKNFVMCFIAQHAFCVNSPYLKYSGAVW